MNWFKEYSKDFPTLGGGAVLGLFLLFTFGMIVNVRLAFGKVMPDGYEFWILALLGLAGVTTVGMIGKRATDRDLAAIKASAPIPTTTTTETQTVSTEKTVAAPVPVPVAPAQPMPVPPAARDD